MPDTKDLLERAGRAAPVPALELDHLRRRHERRVRRERVAAAGLGLSLVLMVVLVAWTVLPRSSGRNEAVALGDVLPPATQAPVAADPGQYHYRAILIAQRCVRAPDVCGGNDVRLDATFWWSPGDESGRIAVDAAQAHGIDSGRFGPGEFPNDNGIDAFEFPLEPRALGAYLLERSADDGASPAPLVTPPPEGGAQDGRLWRAITDLLEDPHVTPALRAALLDVAAGLQGSHLMRDGTDPFGRPAHVVEFANDGGRIVERLYVDPASHELLCSTSSIAGGDVPFRYFVVQQAGVVGSTESGLALDEGSVPGTLLSFEDLSFGPGEGETTQTDTAVGAG